MTPKLVSNQSDHSGLGSHVVLEIESRWCLDQQCQKLFPLCWGRAEHCSWWWLVAQTFYPSLSATLQPLANRPLGYTQGIGNITLLPIFPVQFPSTQTAAVLELLMGEFLCNK